MCVCVCSHSLNFQSSLSALSGSLSLPPLLIFCAPGTMLGNFFQCVCLCLCVCACVCVCFYVCSVCVSPGLSCKQDPPSPSCVAVDPAVGTKSLLYSSHTPHRYITLEQNFAFSHKKLYFYPHSAVDL